jgi:hypothetical protein
MRTKLQGGRGNRGMVSVAVIVFAGIAMMVLVANYELNFAATTTGDAFDSFNSQMVEKNGVAQIVKESILAVEETAVVNSGNPIDTEIQNRLGSMTFPSDVTLTLDSWTAVPANPYFPVGSPLPTAQASYFSSSPRGLAGMGALLTSLAMQGPVADMGRLTYTFNRASSTSGDSRTYTIYADLFSMPLTNLDVVAYGLPASGTIPLAAPTVPNGFTSGVSALVVTSNNPANDPTAYPDLYASGTIETLPYQYRDQMSCAWNAYEMIWSANYQNALTAAAGLGGTYDLAAAIHPPVAGLTAVGSAITIDCSQVTSPVVAVIDEAGTANLTILGSPVGGSPFVLVVRNLAAALGQTAVTFSGSNNRPAIYYLENSNVTFAGSPQIEGGLFFDPTTTGSGSVTWFGHFSFYGAASPLATLGIAVNDAPAVKTALADIAPRVLLVSTSSAPLIQ